MADRPRLESGDDAIGTPVLEELYEQMKSSPMKPDLPAMWKQLGVEAKGDSVEMDDHAPEASIRKAISTRPADAPKDCVR